MPKVASAEIITPLAPLNPRDMLDLEAPKCEVCAEMPVACRTELVGMCDDCFEDAARDAMSGLMGATCCSVSRNAAGFLQICLAPFGIEHDHGQ